MITKCLQKLEKFDNGLCAVSVNLINTLVFGEHGHLIAVTHDNLKRAKYTYSPAAEKTLKKMFPDYRLEKSTLEIDIDNWDQTLWSQL